MFLNTAQQCLSFNLREETIVQKGGLLKCSRHPLALFDVITYQMSNRISLIVSEGMQSKGEGSPHGLVAF